MSEKLTTAVEGDERPPQATTTALKFGVFRLGQLWSVIGDNGQKLGFTSRQRALAAVELIARTHRAYGEQVEVVVQDDLGRLFTLPRPIDPLIPTSVQPFGGEDYPNRSIAPASGRSPSQ